MRGIVISNCQAHLLKYALNVMMDGVSFDAITIHDLEDGKRLDGIPEIARGIAADYDLALSIGLTDRFSSLAHDRIEQEIQPCGLVRIANLYYEGFHPDFCYLTTSEERFHGPLGDYHSRIALASYLEGVSVDGVLSRYNPTEYERFGYFDAAARSIAEQSRRDHTLDVPAAPIVAEAVKTGQAFLTFNHPSASLIWRYSMAVAKALSWRFGIPLSGWVGGADTLPNHLAEHAICPVYPEIADRLGVAGSYRFKPPGLPSLTLRDFLTAEYAAFAAVGREKLVRTGAAQRLGYGVPLCVTVPLNTALPVVSATENMWTPATS
jgi:hypothetical protein